MANRDILTIGSSAGGVEALRFLAKGFPRDFAASVLVTMHLSSQFESALDRILTHAGPLPASFAGDGEGLERSRIYIAPPERHMIVDSDRLWLGTGPQENHARPAIDPMFRSAALCCGSRAIGLVLTGALGDGASGLWALKQSGAITLVQDPSDARNPEMPMAALSRSKPDHVVRLADLPALLISLVRLPPGVPQPLPDRINLEVQIARNGCAGSNAMDNIDRMDRIGRRSVLACPDCGGVMWVIADGEVIRYRCHVGHAYTAEVLNIALDENLRRAQAGALRALEERFALAQTLERDALEKGRKLLAEIWAERKQEYLKEADVIRDSVMRLDKLAADFARTKSTEAL